VVAVFLSGPDLLLRVRTFPDFMIETFRAPEW